MSHLEAGTVVAGKYAIQRLVGEGGMGTVYEGRHMDVGYSVAVKVLREDHLADPETVKRFHVEARAVAKLHSRHVAKVFDVGQLPDGRPFMVLEFLDGTDLESELTRRKRLPFEEALRHLSAACGAMTEAHAASIIHRDLKPANLFLAKEGSEVVLKVVDFGISRVQSEDGVRLTQTQSAFGTPLYMAPESVRSAKLADERTDVWALGVILYELVTGTMPFLGDTPTAVAVAVTVDEIQPASSIVPELPPFVDTLIARALEKNPAKRYQSALEFAQAIDLGLAELRASQLPAGPGVPAPVAGVWDRTHESALIPVTQLQDRVEKPRASRVGLFAAVAAAALAVGGVFGVATMKDRGRPPTTEPAKEPATSPATGTAPDAQVDSPADMVPKPAVVPVEATAPPEPSTTAQPTSGPTSGPTSAVTVETSVPQAPTTPPPFDPPADPVKPPVTVTQPPPTQPTQPKPTSTASSIKGSPTRL